jgi:hypothetical protein
MECNRTRWFVLVALLSLSASARAQTLLKSFHGASSGGDNGHDVAAGFDFDLDGTSDVAMGAQAANTTNGSLSGRATVYSGATGAVLYGFPGGAQNEGFGAVLDFAGDVNLDGWPDLIVGSRPYSTGVGTLPGVFRVFSGQNGSTLYTFAGGVTGSTEVELLGGAVSRVGDVNGDGYADVAAGAVGSHATPASSNQGLVRVYSGFDGSVLHSFWGDTASDNLGAAVTWLGDVDGDGVDDLAGSASCIDWVGNKAPYVHIWSGATGAVLQTFVSASITGHFGYQITGLGDVDGDGRGDLAIGQAQDGLPGQPGHVYVYSGATAALLHTFNGPSAGSYFGFDVSDAGDVDQDGTPDLVVAAPLAAYQGMTWVYSGDDWSELVEIPGLPIGFLGAVDAAGDFDHDGYADVAAARYVDDTFAGTSGVARIYSGRTSVPTAYCTAKLNSKGCYALVSSTGSPSVSSLSPFTIRADGVLNSKSGLLFYGSDRNAQTVPFGTLCVAAWKIVRTPLQNSGGNPPPNDCSGVLTFDFNAWTRGGSDASLVVNQTVCAQYWYRDAASPGGSATSDALQFTLGL